MKSHRRNKMIWPLVAGMILISLTQARATDFNSWTYKSKITFTGYTKSGTLTNFPALTVFGTNIGSFSYGQFASSSGGDLRFSASDGTTELNYQVDTWNTGGTSHVWVQVPTLSSTSDYIWAYWGNSGQTTAPAYTTNGSVWQNAGYVSVWHLGENPTNNASIADSALVNNGTFYKTASYATNGAAGQAVKFGGSNPDYVKVVDSTSLRLTNKIEVSVWMKGWDTDQSFNQAVFVAKTGTSGDPIASGWRLGKQSDYSRIQWRLYGGIGELNGVNNVNTLFNDGKWHYIHAYATYGRQEIYIDGSLENSASVNAWPVATDTNPVTVGAMWANLFPNPAGPDKFCRNSLDEVRISASARSTSWVWSCWMTVASNSTFSSYSAAASSPAVNNDGGASNVTASSAFLNGDLTSAGGGSTTVRICWGLSDGGTDKTSWSNIINLGTLSEGFFSSTVSNLNPNTVYYYRCSVSNPVAETWAPGTTGFTTLVASPAVNNDGGASNVTITAATLNGQVTSAGGETPTATIYWGPTDGGTTKSAWSNAINMGAQSGFFSSGVTSLTPAQTYYYRCYATNSAGDAWASTSASFATEPLKGPVYRFW